MAENFYTILTNVGLAKIANAQVTQQKVDFTHVAVGDSNGSYYNPTATQTALNNEVWRGSIGLVEIDPSNPNWVVIEAVVLAAVGGFTIREIGLFDTDGDLIAIGKYPETYKPAVSQGSAKDLYIRMIIEVSNAASVTLKIDPAVIIASRKYVDERIALVIGPVGQSLQQLQDTIATQGTALEDLSDKFDNMYALTDGPNAKTYAGDLNNLVNSGYYSVPIRTPNAPSQTAKWGVEVFVSSDGNYVLQKARTERSQLNENIYSRSAVKGADGVFFWGVAYNGTGAILNGWRTESMVLSDLLTYNSSSSAASSRAVKQLNDLKADKNSVSFSDLVPLNLVNGWKNFGGEYGSYFFKDQLGIVHFHGHIFGGVSNIGTILFTVPAGYRWTGEMIANSREGAISLKMNYSTGACEVGMRNSLDLTSIIFDFTFPPL